MVQSADGMFGADTPEHSAMRYDGTIFWITDHKLAISTLVLTQLYKAALGVFMDAARKYKHLIGLSSKKSHFDDSSLTSLSPESEHLIGNEVLRHSKSLLVLSCDFGTAWNSRKLVILRNQSFSFLDELQLSTLILSYSPKSECSWSYRRWLIKQVEGKHQDLLEIIGKESELVKKIAEKSKMNYRAWNHRCWLVSYMTRRQVVDELNESRKWAESHIADNCCFHYRRRLMLRLLENKFIDQTINAGAIYKSQLHLTWKEELEWDQMLIEHYIGREALWVHRRFLSQCWLMHFANGQHAILSHSENYLHRDREVTAFLDKELQLLLSCLNITDDEFEDAQVHSEHATSYFLWILKRIPPSQENKLQEKVREMGDMKAVLKKFCSQNAPLWEGLLAGSIWESLFG